MENKLYKAYTGSEIEVILLQGELEENGISSSTQYGSTSGIGPIYGGAPLALDLFINESDFEKATSIIQEFVQNQDTQ